MEGARRRVSTVAATGSCDVRASGACDGTDEVPMRIFTESEPLTGAELDHLGDFLESCKARRPRCQVNTIRTGTRPVAW